MLSGHVVAETLPLPLPSPRAADPLPIGALRGLDASVKLQRRACAGRAGAGAGPCRGDARGAGRRCCGSIWREAGLGGGGVAGAATLTRGRSRRRSRSHSASPARTSTAPLFDLPLDLTGGTVDAHVGVTATGHAPAALLATLAGTGA